MEIIEWLTFFPNSHEYEGARTTLKVEVRIYEQDGEVYAEPIYYKYLDADDRVIIDNAHLTRHGDRMWRFVEHIVDDEYRDNLEMIVNEHPAFEMLHRERQAEKALDLDWYRASVL